VDQRRPATRISARHLAAQVKAAEYPFWSIGIVVPAQNEEASIEPCIQSIRRSCETAQLRDYWIVVVADSCTDETLPRARLALEGVGEVLECDARSAGSARRLGVDAVLAHFTGKELGQIWLANTDADTVVPWDWIRVQLGLADAGIAAVAGIVQLEEGGALAAHEIHRATYLTNLDGTHGHVHGANLALRADAYVDAGGWAHRALAEDHCLWNRLKHRGWQLSSPVSSVVVTSARLIGRARGGFADSLKARIDARRA
jgi:cellulose synthase/poly-beta-1,6-N-acetylglucosamine synthase-like glycosyltransferase